MQLLNKTGEMTSDNIAESPEDESMEAANLIESSTASEARHEQEDTQPMEDEIGNYGGL